MDWLDEKVNDLAEVWNYAHEFDTPEDPAVMGMRAGIERYKDLYDELVEKSAKKDQPKSRLQQNTANIKRGIVSRVQTGGMKVLVSVSDRLKQYKKDK